MSLRGRPRQRIWNRPYGDACGEWDDKKDRTTLKSQVIDGEVRRKHDGKGGRR